MAALTDVRVPCLHEPSHGGHTVQIRTTIGLDGGIALEEVISAVNTEFPVKDPEHPTPAEVAARARGIVSRGWSVCVKYGAVGWDLPEPFSPEALLDQYALARLVAEAAGDLYLPQVLAPFLPAPDETSPTGPTGASTSAPPPSTPRRRRRS